MPPKGRDLALIALRAARESAGRRAVHPGRAPVDNRPLFSRSNPQLIGQLICEMIESRGWASADPLTAWWRTAVDHVIAEHAEPTAFDPVAGNLVVRADSIAWATQLRLLAPQLVERLTTPPGGSSVRTITIYGPKRGTYQQVLPQLPSGARAPERRAVAEPPVDAAIEAARARQAHSAIREPVREFAQARSLLASGRGHRPW
ncbi:DciA family protein [Streptomyces sp. PTM05]|uniref:DciA family protein n=1 Tax=Streptantibioticus parmotrematis TaxID=2873249 RepID=A0ABS7R0X0_9ACTN|nr:DciA family protein [Streptantibioticus parmotrematis]MBY8889117.1 DciA family protein [Streptantibioticus parmotrematis]